MADNSTAAFHPALPPDWYHDAEIFSTECEKLFSRHWWLVGPADQLAGPGDFLRARLGKFIIVLLRNKQGQLRGFHNICRHRAGPLVNEGAGKCRAGLLVCRYHGWSYDLDGRLVSAHDLRDVVNPEEFSLYPVRVDSWNGLLFACIGDAAPALENWLGDIPALSKRFPQCADLVSHGNLEKQGQTNWKCYGENSCEGYHVGMVHKTLQSSLQNEQVTIHCHQEGQLVAFDVTYTSASSDNTRNGKGLWIYKFPGLLLHYSDFTFNAESVMPTSADTVNIKRWFWWLPEEGSRRGIEGSQVLDSASRVMDEDLDICQHVYHNLASGIYQGGVLSAQNEPGSVFFQRLVAELHAS